MLAEVGEPPDVAEADRVAYDGEHELHLVVPGGPLGSVRSVQGLGGGQHYLHAPVVGERGELMARPPVTLTLGVSHREDAALELVDGGSHLVLLEYESICRESHMVAEASSVSDLWTKTKFRNFSGITGTCIFTIFLTTKAQNKSAENTICSRQI